MKIYLVEDCGNSPGRIYACFASESDADRFAVAVSREHNTACAVYEYELWYGQPPVCGVNE